MAVDADAIKAFKGDGAYYTSQINPADGKAYLSSNGKDPQNKSIGPAYIYVDPKGNFAVSSSLNSVVNRYLADLTKSGGIEAVRTVLFNNQYITKKELDSKNYAAFLQGFGKYVNDFSVDQASKIATGVATSLTPFKQWSGSVAGGAGGVSGTTKATGKTKTTDTSTISTDVAESSDITNVTLSSNVQAGNELDAYFQEQLGRNATALEQAAYLNQLNVQEKASTTTSQDWRQETGTSTDTRTGTTASASTGTQTVSGASTTTTSNGTSTTDTTGKSTATRFTKGGGTTIGGPLTQADHNRIMGQVLSTALQGMTGEELMKTNGSIAQGIDSLMNYAADYAIPNYTTDMALKHITDKLASGAGAAPALTTFDAEKGIIRSMAKAFYPNLSKLIDEGVKVSSIGGIYAQTAQKVLELPASQFDMTNDPYISMALLNKGADGKQQDGTMGLNDFTIALRKDPRWSKTQNAREEAAGYANSILQSFGLA